jgi:hypothetical protein
MVLTVKATVSLNATKIGGLCGGGQNFFIGHLEEIKFLRIKPITG